MGVCEGFPKSIIPDHLARADYHGARVNQSARYMDAGREGEGGVIVTRMRGRSHVGNRMLSLSEGLLFFKNELQPPC